MKNSLFYAAEIEGFAAVEETLQITEKSAASRIHFLKKKVNSLALYKDAVQASLDRLSRFYRDADHPLLVRRKAGEKALLVVTGAKGVVGGLYHDLITEAVAKKSGYNRIWVIGGKGKEYLEEEGVAAEELVFAGASDGGLRAQEIQEIGSDILGRFRNFNLQTVDVLYQRFLSLAEQRPTTTRLLPFDFAFAEDKNGGAGDGFPIFEPSKKLFFGALMEKYVNVFFAQLVLEAKLSELAARTVTAESAIKETVGIVASLRKNFLKDKHRSITEEQVESFGVHRAL